MSFLQILWFVLIGVLFAGFFFLEGFDYGVGILHLFLGKGDTERDQIMHTIEPVWDGNEVWLLTAGGAMFASYPLWYASLFSGYYLLLFAVLVGLILRGVSFVFRHNAATTRGKHIWDGIFGIASILPPFFLGVVFTSMVSGMPLDAHGNINAGFGDYFTLFSLVGGIAVLLLCILHGLNYLALKTLGPVRERSRLWAKRLYPVLFAGLAAFAILLYFYTDFLREKTLITILLLVVIVALSVLAYGFVRTKREGLAFAMSGLTFIALVALLFAGLFPRVMVSSADPAHSLLIQNASSSPLTLHTMSIVTLCILPIVLAYQAWTFHFFRKRVGQEARDAGNY